MDSLFLSYLAHYRYLQHADQFSYHPWNSFIWLFYHVSIYSYLEGKSEKYNVTDAWVLKCGMWHKRYGEKKGNTSTERVKGIYTWIMRGEMWLIQEYWEAGRYKSTEKSNV